METPFARVFQLARSALPRWPGRFVQLNRTEKGIEKASLASIFFRTFFCTMTG
jgi:hypothetical protein